LLRYTFTAYRLLLLFWVVTFSFGLLTFADALPLALFTTLPLPHDVVCYVCVVVVTYPVAILCRLVCVLRYGCSFVVLVVRLLLILLFGGYTFVTFQFVGFRCCLVGCYVAVCVCYVPVCLLRLVRCYHDRCSS